MLQIKICTWQGYIFKISANISMEINSVVALCDESILIFIIFNNTFNILIINDPIGVRHISVAHWWAFISAGYLHLWDRFVPMIISSH